MNRYLYLNGYRYPASSSSLVVGDKVQVSKLYKGTFEPFLPGKIKDIQGEICLVQWNNGSESHWHKNTLVKHGARACRECKGKGYLTQLPLGQQVYCLSCGGSGYE